MTGTSKRTILSSDNVDKIIKTLKKIIAVLEETQKNKKSFASSCKEQGLNWKKVRHYLININNCLLEENVSYELPENEVFDGYERLYSKIFGETQYVKAKAILPYDYKESVEYVLELLNTSERNLQILRAYFGLTEDGSSANGAEIARQLGLSNARVNEIIRSMLRRLRHPSYSRILRKGISIYLVEQGESQKTHYDSLAQIEIERLEAENTTLKHQLKEIKQKKEDFAKQASDFCINTSVLDEHIASLNLSTRAYNCLLRRGANTIESLLNYTRKDLLHTRNLGEKSVDMILKEVDEYLKKNCDISLLQYHQAIHKNNFENYI